MKLTKQQWLKIAGAVLAALTAALTTLGFTSCGTTRATISKPAEGTQTTITITTNNPVTTNVSPETNFNQK